MIQGPGIRLDTDQQFSATLWGSDILCGFPTCIVWGWPLQYFVLLYLSTAKVVTGTVPTSLVCRSRLRQCGWRCGSLGLRIKRSADDSFDKRKANQRDDVAPSLLGKPGIVFRTWALANTLLTLIGAPTKTYCLRELRPDRNACPEGVHNDGSKRITSLGASVDFSSNTCRQ